MTATVTTAFWSVTINNYDDRDLAIVRNGYPDYCREIVHTLEEGKEGTPHIQAWVKLQRQQRMSFLRKLFPGGHFKSLTSAEYVENTKQYAQKDDETTRSAHVHVFNDPTGTVESLIPKVIGVMNRDFVHVEDREHARYLAEQEMVKEDYKLAKIFVSAVYKAMWRHFGSAMMTNVVSRQDTHTHTHTPEKNNLAEEAYTDAEEDSCEGSGGGKEDEGDDYDEGSEDEAYSESECSECSQEDDC